MDYANFQLCMSVMCCWGSKFWTRFCSSWKS